MTFPRPTDFQPGDPDHASEHNRVNEHLNLLHQATERALYGTGNPNGVHAAPIGSVFRNTEAGGWNGARVWRKDTGTGNTGWVVESGDTGWRNVSTLLPTNWVVHTAAPSARIKREGNQISAVFRLAPSSELVGSNRANGQLTEVFNVPSGWQPGTYAPWGSAYLTLPGGNDIPGILNTFSVAYILAIRVASSLSGVWASGDGLSFTANWTVSTAWPTTLPGTSA